MTTKTEIKKILNSLINDKHFFKQSEKSQMLIVGSAAMVLNELLPSDYVCNDIDIIMSQELYLQKYNTFLQKSNSIKIDSTIIDFRFDINNVLLNYKSDDVIIMDGLLIASPKYLLNDYINLNKPKYDFKIQKIKEYFNNSFFKENPGYHLSNITRGEFGCSSKIKEEVDEIIDAELQGNKIMTLVELSDLYGAIEGYLANNFPNFTMEDLKKMSNTTQRAFINGRR